MAEERLRASEANKCVGQLDLATDSHVVSRKMLEYLWLEDVPTAYERVRWCCLG